MRLVTLKLSNRGSQVKAYFLSVILILITLLSSCATMNEAECLTADWQGIGYEDGATGRDAVYIGERRSDCAKFDVTLDIEQYRFGYDDGLEFFCRESNGFALGQEGTTYNGVCPVGLEQLFLSGYNRGYELYELESSIDQATQNIIDNESEILSLGNEVAGKEATLVSDDSTEEVRTVLLREVRDLEQEIGSLEVETLVLERERAVLEQKLIALENLYGSY